MYEYHAIQPEEMTTCMKLKISENIHKLRTNETQTKTIAPNLRPLDVMKDELLRTALGKSFRYP